MKEIQLTKGKVEIVDDDDFDWLSQWKWCAYPNGNTFYAIRNVPKPPGGKRTTQLMHRAILERHGVKIDGLEVDHRNHNGLDNRKENLRVGTHAENMGNWKHHDDNYIGASLYRGRWRAHIHAPKKIHLGSFDTAIEAALAHDEYIFDNGLTGQVMNFPEVFAQIS